MLTQNYAEAVTLTLTPEGAGTSSSGPSSRVLDAEPMAEQERRCQRRNGLG